MNIPQPSGWLSPRRAVRAAALQSQYHEKAALRFWFVPPCTTAFLDFLAEKLDSLSACGAEPVKQNPLRQVWQMKPPAGTCPGVETVFLKVYRPAHGRETLKQAVLGTTAAREWFNLLYAQAHDLPAVPPLALIEEKQAPHRGRTVLVTQAIPRAQPLSKTWLESLSAERTIRQQILSATADTLARVHQAGLSPADLHPGNLLLAPEMESADELAPPATEPAPPGNRCYLVDLYKARAGRPVSDRQVIGAFIELNQWFRGYCPRSDRVRFAQLYLRQRDLYYGRLGPYSRNLGLDLHDLVCAVVQQEPIHAEHLAKERDKRIFGDGRYFARLQFDDGRSAVAWLTSKHPGPSPISQMTFTADDWRIALQNRPELWEKETERADFTVGGKMLELGRCWPINAPLVGRGLFRHRQLWLKGRLLVGQRAAWAALWHDLHRGKTTRWPVLLLESPRRPPVVWLAAE